MTSLKRIKIGGSEPNNNNNKNNNKRLVMENYPYIFMGLSDYRGN